MTRLAITYLAITIATSGIAGGQEMVTGLTGNSLLTDKILSLTGGTKGSPDTLQLPFFDDFSGKGPYPNPLLWADRNVFVNNTFPSGQRTMGVATFDLLDETGRVYSHAETTTFKADVLTSNPVDLEFLPSDDIWLSFLYQPGGIGDPPQLNDSLTLQFFAPETETWHPVWKAYGSDSKPFKAVILPVTDGKFLKKGFRFRFTAYGSLTSSAADPAMRASGDNWHIDYVKLDKERHQADTILHDVAFTMPLKSLLNNHKSMPLPHYRQVYLSEMGSFIPVTYRNNDTITRNVTRQFRIYNLYTNTLVHSFSGGATNAPPESDISYNAPLFYTFPTTGPDTAQYLIKSFLITDEFDPKSNDTITYIQDFRNSFSFDDGTAEAGYGINGQGAANAMVAFRFRAYLPDSLRAISISFNHSHQNANIRAFDLMVWENNNGVPGSTIYTEENVMVDPGEGINGFYTWVLQSPVYVDNIFFIGWRQRSETFLNAGVDLNNYHNGRQFYWINGDWYPSQINGTLMIRAITGPRIPLTTVDDTYANRPGIILYPNPATEILNISLTEELLTGTTFTIYDLNGRVVLKTETGSHISINHIQPGIYIVVASRNGMPFARERFIKSK